MRLTILYDGHCPLCLVEMTKLKSLDTKQNLAFVDIHQANFSQVYPDLDWHTLNASIHGIKESGDIISGLDALHLAWGLVGKGWVYAPLRWPIIRWFADRLYMLFARHRYAISYLLTGQKRCQQCEAGKQVK